MDCSHNYYRLEIPPTLPQDIPALEIRTFPEGFEFPAPDEIGDIRPSAYTPAQFPLLTGALRPRSVWAIACLLSPNDALQLQALYRWQQNRIQTRLDPRLLWTDRFNTTEPEPAGNLTRDITDAITTAYGMTYGFPVVACTISKPSCPWAAHSRRECSFSVEEYRV